jgi:hypothetical protein
LSVTFTSSFYTQLFYKIDDTVQDWVMGTAAKIWRDFKADLKRTYFDENKTDKDLIAHRDERVNAPDWKWLINHWRSPLVAVIFFGVLFHDVQTKI